MQFPKNCVASFIKFFLYFNFYNTIFIVPADTQEKDFLK